MSRSLRFILERSKDFVNTLQYIFGEGVGKAPLHNAVIYNNQYAVEILLRGENVDANLRDGRGQTPIDHACGDRERSGIVAFLAYHERVKVTARTIRIANEHRQHPELIDQLTRRYNASEEYIKDREYSRKREKEDLERRRKRQQQSRLATLKGGPRA